MCVSLYVNDVSVSDDTIMIGVVSASRSVTLFLLACSCCSYSKNIGTCGSMFGVCANRLLPLLLLFVALPLAEYMLTPVVVILLSAACGSDTARCMCIALSPPGVAPSPAPASAGDGCFVLASLVAPAANPNGDPERDDASAGDVLPRLNVQPLRRGDTLEREEERRGEVEGAEATRLGVAKREGEATAKMSIGVDVDAAPRSVAIDDDAEPIDGDESYDDGVNDEFITAGAVCCRYFVGGCIPCGSTSQSSCVTSTYALSPPTIVRLPCSASCSNISSSSSISSAPGRGWG